MKKYAMVKGAVITGKRLVVFRRYGFNAHDSKEPITRGIRAELVKYIQSISQDLQAYAKTVSTQYETTVCRILEGFDTWFQNRFDLLRKKHRMKSFVFLLALRKYYASS